MRWKPLNVIPDDAREDGDIVPEVGACYAIYLDGELAYIGSTANLRARMGEHGFHYARYAHKIVTRWGRFDRVHVKYKAFRRFGEWLMVEARLIRRLSPPFNKRAF